MAEEDFSFQAQNGCGVCPLTLLPPASLARLLRPPFRKRHPFIFWPLLILGIITVFFSARAMIEDEESGIERIALVRISGPIMDIAPALEWIRKIEYIADAKGVLVRVDSPGGGAAASQELYAALARLAAKKPLAVSMGSTAASGGLMASMAGQRVFANASTVTGSIGVRMDIPQLQGLMQKVGIGQETLVTAPYKDAASCMRPMTPEDKAYLEKVLMNMHGQFIDIVAAGRKMPREKAAALANGKIFTGQEALALGLVDELGGMDSAIIWLSEKTGVPASRDLLKRKANKTRLLESLLAAGKALGLDFGAETVLNVEKSLGQPAFLY